MSSLEPTKKFFLKRALRRRSDTNAWVRQTGSFATQPCRVLDISGTGIRLQAVGAQSIPDSFTLLFSKSSRGHRASVVWRRGNEVGAEFFTAAPPREPS